MSDEDGARGGGGPAAAWAVAGVAAVFGWAVLRLGARGVAILATGLATWEWAALAALTAAFVYGEGVRALGRVWVPWMIGRARRLGGEGLHYRLLGPLYAMALVGGDLRLVVRAWAGVGAIAVAVLVVSRFPEPWRGITDLAVAAALAWGLVEIVLQARVALRTPTRPAGR